MELQSAPKKEGYKAQPGEEYMSPEQLEYFKNILLEWKASICDQNLIVKNKLQEDTSPLPDFNDRASLEEEFALSLRARDRERKLLRKINDALERIADDDFGYCDNCGIDIGIARLEARPTAELCFDCKELAERKEIKIREAR